MVKGRSSKATVADTSKEVTKKVSNEENATILDAGNENDREWNMLRVTADDNNGTTLCKNDGCEQPAVATWVNKNEFQDERPLCETCQEKEHGGLPNGSSMMSVDPITSKSNVLVESTKNATTETPTNVKQEEDTAMDVDIKEESTSTTANVKMEDSTVQEEEQELDATSTTTTTSSADNDQVMEECDDTQDKDQDASAPSGSHNNDDEDEEWELKEILSSESITTKSIKCHTEECKLLACCIYVSSTSREKWYSCIDCQVTDFGGWPPLEELPVKSLGKNHMQLLVDKCSKKKRPAMPAFDDDDDDSCSPMRDSAQGDKTNTITPLQQASKGSKVTPTPAAKQDTKKKAKQSAIMMKKHQEWQEAANKAGGGRIVVNKEQAKPLIFQMLYDKMKPMNITQIFTVRVLSRICAFCVPSNKSRCILILLHFSLLILQQELKATVPSSVLKLCLDDMALDNKENQFYDSDDEDEAPQKKAIKSEPLDESFTGALLFKGGRNPNSSLYYVDQTKLKNMGDGLEPHARNELASDLAKDQEQKSVLCSNCQGITKETVQLLSEPTNEEADAMLEQQEPAMIDIRKQLEESRAMKCNEKVKKQLKARVGNQAAQWRKRKNMCMDFLLRVEDGSEGTISAKKCCSGDGQMDVESDETVIKNAIEYGKKKRTMASRPLAKKKMKLSKGLSSAKTTGLASESVTNGLTADVNFVAVRLNSSGNVERVYLGDDE